MPKPKKGESKQDYLSRCTRELIESEGRAPDQAYALCNVYWDQAHAKAVSPIMLSADLSLALSDDGKGIDTFMMTAYTGRIIDLGWFGRFIFDINGITVKNKFPVLREHERDRIVGYGKRAWVEDGNFYVAGDFSRSTSDAKEVLALAREGYPWQASVGISPIKVKVLEDEKDTMVVNGLEVHGPIQIWLKSKIGEISFVSLGADDESAAIVLREESTLICEGGQNMSLTLQDVKTQHGDIYEDIFNLGVASVDTETLKKEARAAGVEEERNRVLKILEARAGEDITIKAIKDGISVEAAGWLFFEAEKAARGQKLNQILDAPASAGQLAKEANKQQDFLSLRDAYRQEHKCGLGTATSAVAKQYPELHKAWLESVMRGGK